jgi:predicted Zn-dependent protease
MMEVEPQMDYRPQGVARAEKDLEKGNYRAAAGAIIRMMPHVKSLKVKESSSIVARAQRVLAVATVRSGGELDVSRELPGHVQGTWLGKTSEDKQANLEFAVAALSRVSELKDDDPAVQTELAEAMAQLDNKSGEAKALLEKLAKKDLIATPEGYAALAELRQKRGDQKGSLEAMKRCQQMSNGSTICGSGVAPSHQS